MKRTAADMNNNNNNNNNGVGHHVPRHAQQTMAYEVEQPPTPVVTTHTHSSPASITVNKNLHDRDLKGKTLEEGGKAEDWGSSAYGYCWENHPKGPRIGPQSSLEAGLHKHFVVEKRIFLLGQRAPRF